MTDEKMAEEYRKSLWQRLTDEDNFERLEMFDENVEEAYLAGLKEGRPKWHKVADGDLPKEKKEYWCKVFYYESEETFNAFLWFDPDMKDFKNLEDIDVGDIESIFKVKEWCEIPQ